jgi:hypothetical protein
VLQLLEERARGQYTSVRHLVLYHGLPLFGDLAEPGRWPPFSRRGTPVIGRAAWDASGKVNRLLNESDIPWQVRGGSSGAAVKKGSSVPLQPNMVINLGAGKRLLQVIE